QRRDVDVQVRLLDHRLAPHGVEQLVLADQLAGLPEQGHEQVEGPRAQCDGPALDAKEAMDDIDLDAAEGEGALHAIGEGIASRLAAAAWSFAQSPEPFSMGTGSGTASRS